jgi:5-methylcytosine-specific restriction endonuclease McrA
MARPIKQTYNTRRTRASNFTKKLLVRLFVFNRDGNRCRQCGVSSHLTVDHIISVYRGGSESWENLQTLCNRCNAGKAP